MDDKTTLEDLLKLELHKYEEEVKNIVDKAVKEMSMEKVLKELHNTWDTLEFGKETHERTKLNVLKISEETIEMLEENQVCIGISSSLALIERHKISLSAGATAKYVGFQIRRLLPRRSDGLAKEAQQCRRHDQRLVSSPTNVDTSGEHFYRFGRYKKPITGRIKTL